MKTNGDLADHAAWAPQRSCKETHCAVAGEAEGANAATAYIRKP